MCATHNIRKHVKYVSSQTSNRIGLLCAVLAALCWGSAAVMTKATLAEFAPVLLLVLQLAASVVCLWFFVWLRRPIPAKWSDIAKFAWLGLLEPGLAYLLAFIGLTDTEAGGATLIFSSESILIVIVSAMLFRERPTGRFILLSILALAGLLIALDFLHLHEAVGPGSVGKLLILCGTAVAAVYVVLSGRIAARADPMYIVAWQQTVALGFALLMWAVEWMIRPQVHTVPSTVGIWLFVGITGVVQYAVGFSLYMKALRTVNANTAGSFLTLTPLFGLGGAFLFLHEKLSVVQAVGAALTIVSVALISLVDDHATE